MADNPLADSLLNGLGGGIGGCIIGLYVAFIIICVMKEKVVFAVIGVVLLFVPATSIFPVIGAIRIAKPNSIWGPQILRARQDGACPCSVA